jgi:hypothetical protein
MPEGGSVGEIADMMLDGMLCACCGTYIGEDAGYPLYCSPACEPEDGVAPQHTLNPLRNPPARYSREVRDAKPYSCQIDGCGKRFASPAAKRNHRKMKHGIPASLTTDGERS